MEKVDFLGIGVQKSASTWLWANLKEHPDIWMPPRKELHYFDRLLKYPSPSFLATSSVLKRFISRKEHDSLYRKKLVEEFYQAYKEKNREKITWLIDYYLKNCNDRWYQKLFKYGSGYTKGEITPAYSILDIEDIRHIKRLFPEIRILLTLRNPIERAWSQVKFYVTRDIHKLSSKNEQALIDFLNSPRQTMRSDYIKIVNDWRAVFGDNLHIGYYDEILENPNLYLKKIYNFLGISSEYGVFLNKRINESLQLEIPKKISDFLHKKYDKEILELYKILRVDYVYGWSKTK